MNALSQPCFFLKPNQKKSNFLNISALDEIIATVSSYIKSIFHHVAAFFSNLFSYGLSNSYPLTDYKIKSKNEYKPIAPKVNPSPFIAQHAVMVKRLTPSPEAECLTDVLQNNQSDPTIKPTQVQENNFLPTHGLEEKQHSLNLQKAIKERHADQIWAIALNEKISDKQKFYLSNTTLPNGEMPLHFSIREGHFESMQALLKMGAEAITTIDFQNLTAIDHAILMGNEEILHAIVAHLVNQKFSNSVDLSSEFVAKIKNTNTKINNINNATPLLAALAQAANTNNWDEIKKNINIPDENGFTAIHYAILLKKNELVEKLIELGADTNIRTKEAFSLLYYAAICNSAEIAELLMAKDANLKKFESSLAIMAQHFDAIVKILGAVEKHKSSTFERDPLAFPTSHAIAIIVSLLILFSDLGQEIFPANFLPAVIFGLTMSSSSGSVFFKYLPASIRNTVSWMQYYDLFSPLFFLFLTKFVDPSPLQNFKFLSHTPIIYLFQTDRIIYLTLSAFEGLKKCWQNVGYRKFAAVRNAAIYTVGMAASAHSFYLATLSTINWATSWFSSGETFINEKLICDNIDASLLKENPLERILQQNCLQQDNRGRAHCELLLNPKCPNHALKIISPKLTFEQLYDKKLFKGALKDLNKYHPDKCLDPFKEECGRAFQQINLARETLEQWIKDNPLKGALKDLNMYHPDKCFDSSKEACGRAFQQINLARETLE